MSDGDGGRGVASRRRRWSEGVLAPGVAVRLQYACYLFVGLLLTMLCRGALGNFFDRFAFLRAGCSAALPSVLRDACTGEMMTYRVSFALFVFFLLHWLSVSDLTLCVQSSARAALQERFFYAKTVLLIVFVLATFALPNKFFAMYAYVALFASALFLLMNVLFLVDSAYQWSDDWGERAEHNVKWMWYLLAVAVGGFVVGIVVNVVAFVVFMPQSDCNYNAFAITTVLVGALLYTVLSIWAPHGSIVPSAIVFVYTSCVLFATLRTESDARCNRLATSAGGAGSLKQMALSSLVASFTLGYAVVSSGGNGAAFDIGRTRLSDNDGDVDYVDDDPDETGHLSHYMFFYFVMMMGSMYLAMLASGWRVSGAGDDVWQGSVNVAFWVRSTTVWVTMVLYIWSVLAPYTCCKGRDFGFSVDDDEDWLL